MSEAMAARRAQKDEILTAALQHVAFDGWSQRTVINAAADAGLDAATAMRLFPQGGDSLLTWLDDWTDRQMLAALAGEDLSTLPVRRRVAAIVRARLQLLEGHKEAVRRAIAARTLPSRLGPSLRGLWRSVDLIWDLAGLGGDRHQGLSWYTRRATLAGVLASTSLFWLDDLSAGHGETWAFLDRRIEDVLRLGRARSQLAAAFRFMPRFRSPPSPQ